MAKAPNDDPAARAAALRDQLRAADRAYYVDASPIMSDAEYDRLMAELAALEAEHPGLDDPASPTRRVGGEPIEGFATLPHAVPMLSIDNSYTLRKADKTDSDKTRDAIDEWAQRVRRLAEAAGFDGPTRFAMDPKIDGVALSLRYEAGGLVRALTRGDGERGMT